MFNHLSSLVKASVYYIIALGLAVVAAAIVVLAPELVERLGQIDLYMLTPLLAVLLMLLVVTRDGFTRTGWKGLGLHRLGLRSWGWRFSLRWPCLPVPMVSRGAWASVASTCPIVPRCSTSCSN